MCNFVFPLIPNSIQFTGVIYWNRFHCRHINFLNETENIYSVVQQQQQNCITVQYII